MASCLDASAGAGWAFVEVEQMGHDGGLGVAQGDSSGTDDRVGGSEVLKACDVVVRGWRGPAGDESDGVVGLRAVEEGCGVAETGAVEAS